MKTVTKPSQGFTVRFQNPYQTLTVKELLEDKLLIPRKIRHFLRTKRMFWLMAVPLLGKVLSIAEIRLSFSLMKRTTLINLL